MKQYILSVNDVQERVRNRLCGIIITVTRCSHFFLPLQHYHMRGGYIVSQQIYGKIVIGIVLDRNFDQYTRCEGGRRAHQRACYRTSSRSTSCLTEISKPRTHKLFCDLDFPRMVNKEEINFVLHSTRQIVPLEEVSMTELESVNFELCSKTVIVFNLYLILKVLK